MPGSHIAIWITLPYKNRIFDLGKTRISPKSMFNATSPNVQALDKVGPEADSLETTHCGSQSAVDTSIFHRKMPIIIS